MRVVPAPAVAGNEPPSVQLSLFFWACAAAPGVVWVLPAPPAPAATPPPPAGLIRVTRNSLTGEVTELWYLGKAANEREDDLRAVHAPGGVVRATGRPPRAASAWSGPIGEHLAVERAVTLRYRPNRMEPPPGQRLSADICARLHAALFGGGEP